MEVQQSPEKTASHFGGKVAINIEFQDLAYSVPVAGKAASKTLLKGVNGCFKAGQVTAILGPSGAGKSTLLNILAGYKCPGATGLVTVNGAARDMQQFRRLSRYIMQDNLMQPFLTVEECMLIAAELKVSVTLSREDRIIAIMDILNTLNLLKHKSTVTERLSGGEKKRLSIALELVSNPAVIFLDEPITGLDEAAGFQCVSLLKTLAQDGRTVVCSVHAPSAKVFGLFDHVYVLSQGQCVFQGVGSDIVPVLAGIELPCPTHYNPADFIIDVASGEYGHCLDKLTALTNNGKHSCTVPEPHQAEPCGNEPPEFGCAPWNQFKIVLRRMYLQMSRDIWTVVMLMLMYLLIGVGIAVLFYNVGNNAALAFSMFCFVFCTVLMHTYCASIDPLLTFPMQVQLIEREHFNRWYSLEAYFWARTVFTVPSHVLYSCIFTAVVFWPTGQPVELERMLKFVLVSVLIALVSDTIGLCIATAMNIVNGMFFAQIVMSPLAMLACYSIGYKQIPTLILVISKLNFMCYGVEGLINALFENRERIPCPEASKFCMYTYKKDLMEFFMIGNTNYWTDVAILVAFLVLTKALSLFMLRQRLSPSKAVRKCQLFVEFVVRRVTESR